VVLLAGEEKTLLMNAELNPTGLKALYEFQKILQAASQAVNAMNVDGIPLADEPEHLLKCWSLSSCSARLILEDLIQAHPIQLASCLLVCRAHPFIAYLRH